MGAHIDILVVLVLIPDVVLAIVVIGGKQSQPLFFRLRIKCNSIDLYEVNEKQTKDFLHSFMTKVPYKI